MKMQPVSADLLLKLAVAGAAVMAAVYLIKKAGSPSALGQATGGAAADVVIGVAAGAVNRTGAAFGIPMQDDNQCVIDLQNGDKLAAMSSCKIGIFAKYLFDGTIPNTLPTNPPLPIEFGLLDPAGNWNE